MKRILEVLQVSFKSDIVLPEYRRAEEVGLVLVEMLNFTAVRQVRVFPGLLLV